MLLVYRNGVLDWFQAPLKYKEKIMVKDAKKEMRLRRHFALRKMEQASQKNFADDAQEAIVEPDVKAQLVGLLDPAKCDDAVLKALAEACAMEEDKAKELIEAIKQANDEGAAASAMFASGDKLNTKLHIIDMNFSRKCNNILKDFSADEDKAVSGEVLSKDVATIIKALDDNAFEAKSHEEIASLIEKTTELPAETTMAMLELKNSPVAIEEPMGEAKEEEKKVEDVEAAPAAEKVEGEKEEKELESESFSSRHKKLQKARQEFAQKHKAVKAKELKPKKIPQVSLDMREQVKEAFNKGKKEPKMRNITDNLEEVRAFSRKRHFAELMRAKRMAEQQNFAEPDEFEAIKSPDPDKPQVATKSNRPQGHLNSTVAARLRSIRQSEATKARDTQGRIEDISAAKAGESLAEMNEMASCPNSRFARERANKEVNTKVEFATLRALLGDKYRE